MIHANSAAAYDRLNPREKLVLQFLAGNGPHTAREVLAALYPGSDNGNLVKPRISDLKRKGRIHEVRQTVENGRRVAVFGVIKKQGNLF